MSKNFEKLLWLTKNRDNIYVAHFDSEQNNHKLRRFFDISVQLLDKTRKINKLLHNNSTHKVVFHDICKVLSDILLSNILVISKKGKVLGVGLCPGVDEIEELIEDQVGGFVDRMLNERLLSILSTKENVNLQTLGFVSENVRNYKEIIKPIDIEGERMGTLILYKYQEQYDIDELILYD